MAFPQVAASASGSVTTADTTHAISLPTGIVSGNLLLAVFGVDAAPTISGWPSGWTQVLLAANSTNCELEVRYKIADGSESGFNLTTSASRESAHFTRRITGAHTTSAPDGTTATNTSTTSNPPDFNPAGWDIEDTLWFAIQVNDNGGTTTSAYPTDYTGGTNITTGGAAGIGLSIAQRELAAASENPTAFTLSASDPWVAATVAVRPAPAVTLVQTVGMIPLN